MRQNGRMGTGDITIDNGSAREASTTLLVLVALKNALPKPMSTYELGLAISDNQDPPRPLSVLVKTLSKDRYIERAAPAGKRAGYWTITDRGLASLERRPDAAAQAASWIQEHPNFTDAERCVLESLLHHGPQPASRLVVTCELLHSPVRTALKRLGLRHLVLHPVPPSADYKLTPAGRRTAEELRSRD